MKKLMTLIVALAMLTAIPLGVMAQEIDGDTSNGDNMDVAYYDPYFWMPEPGGFDYSNGIANGTYVDFELDEAAGTVSDYTVMFIDYNYYYPMVYYDEARPGTVESPEIPEPEEINITIFDTIEVDDFTANGHPANFGERMVFLGENVMMEFYDFDFASAYYQFGGENSTMTLKVADGLEISENPYYWDLYEWDAEDMEEWEEWEDEQYYDESGYDEPFPIDDGYNMTEEEMAMMDYQLFWNWEEVWLTGDNFTCSIWVDRGDVEIDKEANTLTINTYKNASVSISAWLEMPYVYECYEEPWYDELEYDEKGIVETAIEDGLLAAVGYLIVDDSGEDWSESNTFNDPSFQMEFTNIEDGKFDVEVESYIEDGRIVSININEGALDAQDISDLLVHMDDEKIRACDSLEELTEMQDGTEAGYYAVFGEGQTTVFVYVPHFSAHTISIQSLVGLMPNMIVPGILAAAFVAIAIVIVVQRGKRGHEEE